ncbi:hypothetical protein PV326_006515 [Microctonus aethiopoides]|nr:hypothetical protein PV326_006515 [Microctonus aethiopoides]
MSQKKTNYTKKARSARASPLQLTKMIDFFCLNQGLAEGKFHVLHGKEEAQKKWAQLTEELNCFNGASKTVEQWQVWRDLKSRTSIKAKDLRKAKALTGNKPTIGTELNELELRVIGLVGAEYIEGSKFCADSIPDEENLQEELERGNETVLSAPPQVITICPSVLSEISEDTLSNATSSANDVDHECNQSLIHEHSLMDSNTDHYLINEVGDDANDGSIIPIETIVNQSSSKLKSRAPYSRAAPKQTKQSTSNPRNVDVASSSRRARLLQRNTSMEHFQAIVQKQADAELMLAESAKGQAEAAKMSALATSKIAQGFGKFADAAAAQVVNDRERTRVFEKLTNVLENLLPSYINE